MVSTKRTKSIKKVAFESLTNQSPKQENKSAKNLTETSIKIEQTGSQVQSNYLQVKNSTRSLRMTSEHGIYRLLKMAGSQQNQLKLIVKQIVIKKQLNLSQAVTTFQDIIREQTSKHIENVFQKQNYTLKQDLFVDQDGVLPKQLGQLFYNESLNSKSTNLKENNSISSYQGYQFSAYQEDLSQRHQSFQYHDRGQTQSCFDQLCLCIKYIQWTIFKNFIRPPQIILNPLRSFDKGGDIWALGCIIVFMLKGDFPFKDYSDAEMIIRMMKFLGKPSKQYLQSINFKNNKRFIFPDLPKLSMKKFFKCKDNSLLKILQSIFIFQSEKRQTSQNLLASKYFDELRDQIKFKNLQKDYQIDSLFDFSNHMLDINKKKQIVPKWYKSH